MPATGAPIVGPSTEFNQTDWLKGSPAFLNGKKNLYLSWFCKSDVSGTDNVPWAVGQITKSTPVFARHGNTNVVTPTCWAWGYIFTDRSLRFETGAGTGSNNKLQHIACQITAGAIPKMWIDGIAVTANSLTQDPPGAGYPSGGLLVQALDELWIGRGSSNSRLWDGLVDELRIIEDVKDTNYALTEFRNLSNIDDFVVFGDVETPGVLSPRGELTVAEVGPGTTTKIKVDTFVVNPNPSSTVMTAVSVPTRGTAVKVDDSHVNFTSTAVLGPSKFTVTFTSAGKSVVVPVTVNVSSVVSPRPPDIPNSAMSLLPDRVAWEYTPPAGFEGYQPREGPDGATWATATNVGGRTTNKYVMRAGLLTPSKKVLVKPYANGLEALNAAEISLVAPPPPPPGQYYSSPNYGSKTRNDVSNHTELMNAISGINTASAYINMTYTDSSATTISRGGSSTHPLIITAQAPNGLKDFNGRAGFSNTVTITGNYIWLDRLKLRVPGSTAVLLRGGAWNFVTRCQIDAPDGVDVPNGNSTEEFWIGFNQFLGAPVGGYAHIHMACSRTVSTNPRKGRIYYNTMVYPGDYSGENASIMSGPGIDADGARINVNETWAHYNYMNNGRTRCIYMKHGFDVKYNHVVAKGTHSIATRGACCGNCKIEFNRTTGSRLAMQGYNHRLVGNLAPAGIELFAECAYPGRKPLNGADGAVLIGNEGKISLGVVREGYSLASRLKNILIEAHSGSIVDDGGNTVAFGSDGRPVRDQNYYSASSIMKRSTTTVPLETPPVLDENICGPGSTRGKVWGT